MPEDQWNMGVLTLMTGVAGGYGLQGVGVEEGTVFLVVGGILYA